MTISKKAIQNWKKNQKAFSRVITSLPKTTDEFNKLANTFYKIIAEATAIPPELMTSKSKSSSSASDISKSSATITWTKSNKVKTKSRTTKAKKRNKVYVRKTIPKKKIYR